MRERRRHPLSKLTISFRTVITIKVVRRVMLRSTLRGMKVKRKRGLAKGNSLPLYLSKRGVGEPLYRMRCTHSIHGRTSPFIALVSKRGRRIDGDNTV